MEKLVVWIVVGSAVGVLARLFMPGRDRIGIIGTIVIGITGAIVGGYLWREVFGNTEDIEWIGSVLVAMALLWILRRATYGRRTLI